MNRTCLVLAIWIAATDIFCVAASCVAESTNAVSIDFNRQVRPLLAKHCYACHGGDVAESGLRFDLRESTIAEADSGLTAIKPGDPSASEMLRRIQSHEDFEQMPPEGKRLDESSIEILRQWISEGAEYTPHWSFQPIKRPMVPMPKQVAWMRNPIDGFILSRLEDAQLEPNKAADPRLLLRRLSYDLIGLPPSYAAVEEFVAASSDPMTYDQAYEANVEQLLADPGFGERWGRHWLDVVRYAETNSFERDHAKPNAWRYRDYVIDALNSDKPYDQFIREQLAGDELADGNNESLIATGYYRLGIWDDEPADPEQARFDEFDDLVTVTSQGFLGLTLNCARCHDHKIDPIKQQDYYAMVAFFRDVTSYGERTDELSNSQIDLSGNDTVAQRAKIKNEIATIKSQRKTIEQSGIAKMDGEDQRATEGEKRKEVLDAKLLRYLEPDQISEYQSLHEKIRQLQSKERDLPPADLTLGLAKCLAEPPETFKLLRGSPHAPGDKVEPSFISLLDDAENQYEPEIVRTERSAGRRRELANWIASEKNWFTARVIVNRLWQHHFGRGIVRSSNNFGQLGDIPTHPELLDYLASELIRYEWNLKPIHRLILTSQTYRMASIDQAAGLASDPRNDLFWRYDPRRLSAEELRDTMLATNAQIDHRFGGPSVFPEISDEVKAGQSRPGEGWGTSSAADKARRSVYIFIKRSLVPPELSVFDFPETDGTCEARFLTTQAAQALNLLNGSFSRQSATKLAELTYREFVIDDVASVQTLVSDIIPRVYQRPANSFDLEHALDLLTTLDRKHNLQGINAWQAYCLVMLNTNEFIYLD